MCLPIHNLEEVRLEKGELHGFEYEIVNANAHRCGYIKVLPGHPWFGKSYSCHADEHYEDKPHDCTQFDADVHGGITFAEHGKACPTHGPEAEWWVGFDCAHSGDLNDPDLAENEAERERIIRDNKRWDGIKSAWPYTVKTTKYVRAQCRKLARQAANVA